MSSENILDEVTQESLKAFNAQDPELFNVVFEIGLLKIYADRGTLSVISSTFKSILCGPNNSMETQIITIKDYKYEDFKEFLTFFYSGICNITDSNILTMLELAAFYRIKHLKELCDLFLSKTEYLPETLYQCFEIAMKYDLLHTKNSIDLYIAKNYFEMLTAQNFNGASSIFVKHFCSYNFIREKPLELFDFVYQWLEYQVIEEQEESFNENINDAIGEIAAMLPYRIKVTNSLGQSLFGTIALDSEFNEVIKSLKNQPSEIDNTDFIFWKTTYKNEQPGQLTRSEKVFWYLLVTQAGDIAVKYEPCISRYDYLLAEMKFLEGAPYFNTSTSTIKIV